ncbi:uncharacterized protein LOC119685699 [Teleopsis dalmanni]|uniref:uncharacterized protein LOC119673948 n=1 Tax=Teleopsis dalmanni TaxID=139649 RepID=UPI0018CF1D85|nr:uncharacterized protein LOC119673948 [Teleopsis dalmanni]XP_037955984.1 uncharacterized protein LOC119685699 [Teleopsis dalmanni]
MKEQKGGCGEIGWEVYIEHYPEFRRRKPVTSMGIDAFLKSVRVEEIPFGLTEADRNQAKPRETNAKEAQGIFAVSRLEDRRNFIHIFHVPYIVCFFAAKGKWPFIPPLLQLRVDSLAKSIFNQTDSFIRNFCKKWIQIKECFRPIFGSNSTSNDVEAFAPLLATPCTCADQSITYFDKKYIGKVSSQTIYNTIEFLESFLPSPTKKTKRKNRVRGRLDEIEID